MRDNVITIVITLCTSPGPARGSHRVTSAGDADPQMSVRTVLVCEAQVPFVTGGAESLVRSLVHHLRQRGYDAELVSVPFKWYPKEEILAQAAAWRLLDLRESNGRPIDLVIGPYRGQRDATRRCRPAPFASRGPGARHPGDEPPGFR